MKNKIISCLIIILLLSSVFPLSVFSSEKRITVNINAINSDRESDKIVLYNINNQFTGTNEWGYEVVVTDGIVSRIGGNNNCLPSGNNSFIVSAHGSAVENLIEIEVGMTAEYNSSSNSVVFTTGANTPMTLIDLKRKIAIAAKEKAEKNYYICPQKAEKLFDVTEAKYSMLSKDISADVALQMMYSYEQIAAMYRDAPMAEYRGIWVRPNQKNDMEVEAFVRKCCESGINMISVETLFDCTFICPMPSSSLFEHNPYFNGFDVLDSFSRMCEKYGVELHCWMHIFSVSNPDSPNFSKSITNKRPQWRLADSTGKYNNEFINPAIDEVQEYLINTYKYIIEKYNIKAFQLDYIRYPAVENGIDYGYDEASINSFKQQYPKYTNYKIEYDTTAIYWNDWCEFRINLINNFVERVRNLINDIAPDVLLSADTSASPKMSPYTCYQAPLDWLTDGLLDIVHPMAYGENDYTTVKYFFDYKNEDCMVVPALGAFVEDFNKEDILLQTQNMLEMGCHGAAYFAADDFFNKHCNEFLFNTVFNTSCYPPSLNYANNAVAYFERYIERLDLAIHKKDISKSQYDTLATKAQQIIKTIKNNGTQATTEDVKNLMSKTKEILSNQALSNILLEDLENASKAINKNSENCKYTGKSSYDVSIPNDAMSKIALTIDKVNSAHTGEDSILITDPFNKNEYNINYSFVMLFEPINDANNIYKLIETQHNYGYPTSFKTNIKKGMIVLSLHSNDIGSGVQRRNLAKTLEIGTEMVLWGIDANTSSFTKLNSMMFVYDSSEPIPPDENSDFSEDIQNEVSVEDVNTSDSEKNNLESDSEIYDITSNDDSSSANICENTSNDTISSTQKHNKNIGKDFVLIVILSFAIILVPIGVILYINNKKK